MPSLNGRLGAGRSSGGGRFGTASRSPGRSQAAGSSTWSAFQALAGGGVSTSSVSSPGVLGASASGEIAGTLS